MDLLEGKTVLITGGAGTIGSSIAAKLAEMGCNIAIADRRYEEACIVAGRLKNGMAIACDATSIPQCEVAVGKTLEKFGSVEILIHAASVRVWKTLQDMEEQEWKAVFENNFYSVVNMTRAAMPTMKKQNYGRIIQINSKVGKFGAPGESACSAAMYACRGFIRSIAVEAVSFNILSNVICVGDMPQNPSWQQAMQAGGRDLEQMAALAKSKHFGKACEQKDINDLVAFLLSDSADFMIGQSLNLTGGQLMY